MRWMKYCTRLQTWSEHTQRGYVDPVAVLQERDEGFVSILLSTIGKCSIPLAAALHDPWWERNT